LIKSDRLAVSWFGMIPATITIDSRLASNSYTIHAS